MAPEQIYFKLCWYYVRLYDIINKITLNENFIDFLKSCNPILDEFKQIKI